MTDSKLFAITCALWLALLLAMSTLTIVTNEKRTVTNNYKFAADRWQEGREIYRGTGRGFLYLPQAAIAYIPFANLPKLTAAVTWRSLSAIVFAFGLWRITSLIKTDRKRACFFILSLLSIPLMLDSLRNGQSNIILAGLMMLAIVELARSHWWRSSLYLILSLALKPISLVLILLSGACYKQLRWPLLIGVILLLLFPFWTQYWVYVVNQYDSAYYSMITANNIGDTTLEWAQIFTLLKVSLGVYIPNSVQTVIRLIVALLTLGICYQATLRYPRNWSVLFMFSFACVYLMLFNPRTELNSYAIIAPAYAWLAAEYYFYEKRLLKPILLAVMVLSTAFSHSIMSRLTPEAGVWLPQLNATIFTVWLMYFFYKDPHGLSLLTKQTTNPQS